MQFPRMAQDTSTPKGAAPAHAGAQKEFRPDGMQFDFWFVDDRTDPATGAAAAAWWKVQRGEPILLEAQGPLGPRPPRAATAPQSTAVIPRTGGDQTAALALGAAAVIGLAAKRAKEISD